MCSPAADDQEAAVPHRPSDSGDVGERVLRIRLADDREQRRVRGRGRQSAGRSCRFGKTLQTADCCAAHALAAATRYVPPASAAARTGFRAAHGSLHITEYGMIAVGGALIGAGRAAARARGW